MRSKSSAAFYLAICAGLAIAASAAVTGTNCLYVAGTVPGVAQNTAGHLDLSNPQKLIFNAKAGSGFTIVWNRIRTVEYGQKAGRRLGLALATGSSWVLLSSKRRHFLTLGYTDAAGHSQGVLLELAKNEVAGDLVVIEARSGRKVEYESADAEAHIHG